MADAERLENCVEHSLVFIRPDHVHVAEAILYELDAAVRAAGGTRTISQNVPSIPEQTIREHYREHEGKYFYELLVQAHTGRPTVLAVFEGPPGLVQKIMDVCGATDPVMAGKDTIRGKYGTDSLALAKAEGRTVRNVIHRSDSPAAAEREIAVWASLMGYMP